MPAHRFEYAIVRVVPRVEREEFINAGVILYCRSRSFLAAEIALDRDRLRALDPSLDLDDVERALALIPRICAGDPGAGPIAALDQAERFRWLSAPRSTVTQVSPVHAGLCDDPAETLAQLMAKVVRSSTEAGRA
jgi:Protein of unknown function (DUF3037)